MSGTFLVDASGASGLPAWLAFPPASAPPGERAALLFLHGMHESGVDGVRPTTVGIGPALTKEPDRWPFVVILPQKPSARHEWEEHERDVLALVDRTVAQHGIDRARIGITGISQGGHGAWELARRHPTRFACVAPICGYAAVPRRGWSGIDRARDWNVEQARAAAAEIAERIHAQPVWTAHGDADDAVPVAFTDVVVEALRARGAEPVYERYAGVGHDAWTRAYGDGALAAWLRDQLRAR